LSQQLCALKKIGIKKIYFASDGPRSHAEYDLEKIEACRSLIKTYSSSFSQVEYLYSEQNYGCHTFVPKAISWFFSKEKYGLILEDDCIIDRGFYDFAAYALDKYCDVPEVMCISAANFQSNRVGDGDYFFSKYPYIWGWASWARAWHHYSDNADILNEKLEGGAKLNLLFKDRKQKKYWRKMLSRLTAKSINFWDAKWYFSIWACGGISITPNVNLIRNIGFGDDATHTKGERENPGMKIESISYPIDDPSSQSLDNFFDDELFMKRFKPTVWRYIDVAKNRFKKYFKI
jgi:hypothetical protein